MTARTPKSAHLPLDPAYQERLWPFFMILNSRSTTSGPVFRFKPLGSQPRVISSCGVKLLCAMVLTPSVVAGFDHRAQDDESDLLRSIPLSVASAERTEVLVLGTPHLSQTQGVRPEHLKSLLEVLEAWAPDRVCVETLAPEKLRFLEQDPAYADVVAQFAGDMVRFGALARLELGMTSVEALHSATTWTSARGDRQVLAMHWLAANDVVSATLEWAASRARSDEPLTIPGLFADFLGRCRDSIDEKYSIGVELARRLGHDRVWAIDDHSEKDLYLELASELHDELRVSVDLEGLRNQAVYVATREETRAAVRTGDLLPLYLHMNTPGYGRADVLAQWDLFLKTRLESGRDRDRLALWEVRNLEIASQVRRASVGVPGGRVLVIIGAAHKPFLDSYLGTMLDVSVTRLETLLATEEGGTTERGLGSIDSPMAGPATDYVDEWYLPTADGATQLFVREYGVGEVFVVLHGGWGAEHEYLVSALRSEFDRNRFVLYDQRGSLRSPADVASVSVGSHLADLEALRVELGLERMNLLAHSMGTFLAQSYLAANPDHVGKLVLVAAVPPRMQEGSLRDSTQSSVATLVERPELAELLALEGLDGDGLTARQKTHAWRLRFASVNLFRVDRWRSLAGGRVFYSSVAGDAAAQTMPDAWDFVPALGARASSLTVIMGDTDFIDMGMMNWAVVARELPAMRLEALDHAGHVPWIDRPAAFATALRSALARD